MSTKYEYPEIIHATGSDYLDPFDCGSTVSYRIVSTNYFDAAIDLSDCNRKISWAFNAGDVDKVDRAISLLSDFRKELLKASKKWAKIEEEATKFNEANKK